MQENSPGINKPFELHGNETALNEILIFGDGDCLFNALLIGFLIISNDDNKWRTIRKDHKFNIGEIEIVGSDAYSDSGNYFKTKDSNTRLAIKNYACTKEEDIFDEDVNASNRLTYRVFDEIIGLKEDEYGTSNEIKILSKLLEKDIIVIQPTNLLDEYAAPITIFSKFTPDLTEETLYNESIHELLYPFGKGKYNDTIILHNTGYDINGDNSSQHFNLLLTSPQKENIEQYNAFNRGKNNSSTI